MTLFPKTRSTVELFQLTQNLFTHSTEVKTRFIRKLLNDVRLCVLASMWQADLRGHVVRIQLLYFGVLGRNKRRRSLDDGRRQTSIDKQENKETKTNRVRALGQEG